MKDHSPHASSSKKPLGTDSLVSLKDFLVGQNDSPNPYASIDNFLDDTWNLNISSVADSDGRPNRLSLS